MNVIMTIMIYFKMLITLYIFKQFRRFISLILNCLTDMITFLSLGPLLIFTFTLLNYMIIVKDKDTEEDKPETSMDKA